MSKDEYLITDAPLKALTVFAMPMILGSFFQQVYNMADSIIVGQFVGSSALAAVGACAALTNVFICIALGAGVGAGVLVSRYFGARDYSKMKTIVSTSLISFLILSILLGVFGFCFSHSMMSLLQTPADILEEAVLYLRVYFVGFPFPVYAFGISLRCFLQPLITQKMQNAFPKVAVGNFYFPTNSCYGMSCITTKLLETQMTSIALSVFVTNLFRILRRILCTFLYQLRFLHDWNRYKSLKLQVVA